MSGRETVRGKTKLQLVGGTDAPRGRAGWSPRMASLGTSGSAPRQRRKAVNDTCKQLGWAGLAAHYINTGLPKLDASACTYKVGEFGYTDDGLVAMAYAYAYHKLTGLQRPTIESNF